MGAAGVFVRVDMRRHEAGRCVDEPHRPRIGVAVRTGVALFRLDNVLGELGDRRVEGALAGVRGSGKGEELEVDVGLAGPAFLDAEDRNEPPRGAGTRLRRAGEERAAALGRPLQARRERRAFLLRAFAVARLNPPRFGGGDASLLRTAPPPSRAS